MRIRFYTFTARGAGQAALAVIVLRSLEAETIPIVRGSITIG